MKTFEEAWQELVSGGAVRDGEYVRKHVRAGWDARGAANHPTVPGDSWAFHRHLLLWAKFHYPKLPQDAVEAMRIIMAEVAWVDVEHVTRADAAGFIIDAFSIYVRPGQRQMALRNWLVGRFGEKEGPIDAMVSALRHTLVSELPPLGEKDLKAAQ